MLSNKYEFLFLIVGINEYEILKKSPILKNYIDQLGSKVQFFGKLDNTHCIKRINESDFFIFIRNVNLVATAGFPTKFAESISAGTPVLTNKTSHSEEFLIEGKNGFWLNNISENKLIRQIDFF